jgi:hypothetical protein
MTFNSTPYRDDGAGAHKSVDECEKNDKQYSAPDGKLHQLLFG